MLVVTAHYWGDKYPVTYVRKLIAGIKRHLTIAHRLIVVTDKMWQFRCDNFESIRLIDTELTTMPGCLCRLRMFDPHWQKENGIENGDTIVSLDIDLVITGKLNSVLSRSDSFSILQNVNTQNPCPYNGSVFAFKAGKHADIWTDFSIDAISKIKFDLFPDDQAWFHHKIPNGGAFGPENGIYAFKKKGWPSGDDLPENAKIVAFPGWRDPSKFQQINWIKENWQ